MWCELQLHSQVCDVTATATLLYTTGPRAGTSILSGDKNTEQISLKFWNFLSPIIPQRKMGNNRRKMIFFISTSFSTLQCWLSVRKDDQCTAASVVCSVGRDCLWFYQTSQRWSLSLTKVSYKEWTDKILLLAAPWLQWVTCIIPTRRARVSSVPSPVRTPRVRRMTGRRGRLEAAPTTTWWPPSDRRPPYSSSRSLCIKNTSLRSGGSLSFVSKFHF